MDENYHSFEIESYLSSQIVDYGSMNFVALVDPFCAIMLVDLSHEETNLNFLIAKIPIKFSARIGHALLISKLLWERNLQVRDSELIFHTKYVICNNTIFPIIFS